MAFKTKLITAMLFTGVSLGAVAGSNSDNITLNGVITAVTCNVTANGGNSVFYVGKFAQDTFSPNVQNGDTPLVVQLDACDKASDKGALYVQGTTATSNTAKISSLVKVQPLALCCKKRVKPIKLLQTKQFL